LFGLKYKSDEMINLIRTRMKSKIIWRFFVGHNNVPFILSIGIFDFFKNRKYILTLLFDFFIPHVFFILKQFWFYYF